MLADRQAGFDEVVRERTLDRQRGRQVHLRATVAAQINEHQPLAARGGTLAVHRDRDVDHGLAVAVLRSAEDVRCTNRQFRTRYVVDGDALGVRPGSGTAGGPQVTGGVAVRTTGSIRGGRGVREVGIGIDVRAVSGNNGVNTTGSFATRTGFVTAQVERHARCRIEDAVIDHRVGPLDHQTSTAVGGRYGYLAVQEADRKVSTTLAEDLHSGYVIDALGDDVSGNDQREAVVSLDRDRLAELLSTNVTDAVNGKPATRDRSGADAVVNVNDRVKLDGRSGAVVNHRRHAEGGLQAQRIGGDKAVRQVRTIHHQVIETRTVGQRIVHHADAGGTYVGVTGQVNNAHLH